MKKYFLCVATIAFYSFAFSQPAGTVTIRGILRGDLKGFDKMYLYTRAGTDSTLIKNGHYTFAFPFAEVGMKMLLPEYVRGMNQMYQPFGILITGPGTYSVVSDIAQGLYASSEINGPEGAVLYRQFEKDQGEAYKKINRVLADLYGSNWYRLDENDPQYIHFQKSRDSLDHTYLIPVVKNLVQNHPDSYASAFVLSGTGRQIGSLEQKEILYQSLSGRMKSSAPGKKFGDYIQGLKNSKVGSKVAAFVLPNPEGKNIRFADLKGKYVLIDFWASWCAPCRQSFPRMRQVYQTFKADAFEIYSISIDENKAAWLKAVKDEGNPWLQSLDTKNISQSGFAVTGVPSTFLIDPQGKIILKEVGFDPQGGSEIEKKLSELFGKSVPAPEQESKKSNAAPQQNKKVLPAIKISGS